MFVLLASVCITGADRQFEKRQYSLNTYHRNNWNFYGDAIVQPEFIRLTGDVRSQKGGVSCTAPSTSLDWEIHITFHVHGEGKHLYGDGFAFWYTREPITFGDAFGAQPKFSGLGVFFDTYANQNGAHSHEHPYISVMVSNGSVAYDHDRDGTLTEADGCSSNFRNKPYTTAIISYVANKLSVVLKYPNQNDPVNCIAVENVRLPVGYYFGLSAATGDLSDAHDIYSLRFFEVESSKQSAQDLLDAAQFEPSIDRDIPLRDRVPDDPLQSRTSRIFWGLIFWLFVLGCIGGCCFAAYSYYNHRQRQMKRLY